MSNPAIVSIEKKKWIKIATGVTTGTIHRLSTTPGKYFQTYRTTGDDAPTTFGDGAVMFSRYKDEEEIDSTYEIDIYAWCTRNSGRVRVDV